jgi:hypothetical protein
MVGYARATTRSASMAETMAARSASRVAMAFR